ncbi:hypothetical protein [Sorangium cellulosum]|uniref:hypothetical protein n=1 Tax=Sorangium cellulosum TaxID=56 RepID=UPI001F1F26EE|nr:hypothetical protein [Sorangium cellulosum]
MRVDAVRDGPGEVIVAAVDLVAPGDERAYLRRRAAAARLNRDHRLVGLHDPRVERRDLGDRQEHLALLRILDPRGEERDHLVEIQMLQHGRHLLMG